MSQENAEWEIEGNYTEEVQEIVGRDPDWLIQWGITVIFGVILIILVCTWFISYPDLIKTRITLTTKHAPVKLVAHSTGKVIYLAVNGAKVKAEETIAYIDNPAKYEDILFVGKEIKNSLGSYTNPDSLLWKFNLSANLQLGDLQDTYLRLTEALAAYQSFLNLGAAAAQVKSLSAKLRQYQQLNTQLKQQCAIQKQALDIIENRFKLNEKLYHQQVMSDAEFETIRINYLSAKRNYDISKNNILNNDINISQTTAEMNSLDVSDRQKQHDLRETIMTAFKSLESNLSSWKQRYLINAVEDGNLSIPKFMESNQNLNSNDDVGTIIPQDNEIYGQILLEASRSGKIDVGQKVTIKFDNYPVEDYGMVKGKIKSISAIPQNDMYAVQVYLPDGLFTSYHKKLKFKPLLGGNAEIVTRSRNVFSRIFNHLNNTLNN